MGRKANFDIKIKKGPGRKTRKQPEPNMTMFLKKLEVTPTSSKRFVVVVYFDSFV